MLINVEIVCSLRVSLFHCWLFLLGATFPCGDRWRWRHSVISEASPSPAIAVHALNHNTHVHIQLSTTVHFIFNFSFKVNNNTKKSPNAIWQIECFPAGLDTPGYRHQTFYFLILQWNMFLKLFPQTVTFLHSKLGHCWTSSLWSITDLNVKFLGSISPNSWMWETERTLMKWNILKIEQDDLFVWDIFQWPWLTLKPDLKQVLHFTFWQ